MSAGPASPLEGAEGLCCFAASACHHGTASSIASDPAADFEPELARVNGLCATTASVACSSEASSEDRERLLLRGVSMQRAVGARVQVCKRLSPTLAHASPLSSLSLSSLTQGTGSHSVMLSDWTRYVQVRYMEREGMALACNEYYGTVVSVDLSRGLRVSFEGLRREWVNEHDDWAWVESADDDMWDEGEELWGEEAAERENIQELELPFTKPTARKSRPAPPRRPRPASAAGSEVQSGGEMASGGGSSQPPTAERAVSLGLRGFKGALHRDALQGVVGQGRGGAGSLELLERGTALLEKAREAFLAHTGKGGKGGKSSKSSTEDSAPTEPGARGRPGGTEGRCHGSPLLTSRDRDSPASPRAAPLRRTPSSEERGKASPRSRATGREVGREIEVGASVFCHQVGSRWSRGTVSRVFSSPKWLTVTLEGGQTRPTQRDRVIFDTPPLPEQLQPLALVIAASPPELFWVRAELLEVLPEAAAPRRYRVLAEAEGAEMLLTIEQLRLLPPKTVAAKPESGAKRSRATGDAAPADAAPAEATPAEATPADAPPADATPADATSADAMPVDSAAADAAAVAAPPEPKRPCSPVAVQADGAHPGSLAEAETERS